MRAAVVTLLSLAVLSTPQAAHADVPRGEAVACATQHEFNFIRYNATRQETQTLAGAHRHERVDSGMVGRAMAQEGYGRRRGSAGR